MKAVLTVSIVVVTLDSNHLGLAGGLAQVFAGLESPRIEPPVKPAWPSREFVV